MTGDPMVLIFFFSFITNGSPCVLVNIVMNLSQQPKNINFSTFCTKSIIKEQGFKLPKFQAEVEKLILFVSDLKKNLHEN